MKCDFCELVAKFSFFVGVEEYFACEPCMNTFGISQVEAYAWADAEGEALDAGEVY